MIKYAIWDKVSPVATPSGEVFTAEQWIARYPIAALDSISIVCAAGEMNGAFFGTLGQMKDMWEEKGADFSKCTTPEETIQVINEFNVAEKAEQEAKAAEAAAQPTSEERIAAALEAQNLMAMEDITTEE